MGQKGFWDFEERQQELINKNKTLKHLNDIIPWELFRAELETLHKKDRKSNAGRKPTDVILMFKLLILQQLYNISDEELEYQVKDRLSFMEFLNLGLEDPVPDATTVWLFRQHLKDHNKMEPLFEEFSNYLNQQGYQAQGGQIMDATLIPVPKQKITKQEKEDLKQGQIPEEWQNNPHKMAQKDIDAKWTKKNHQSYFGYKNHINIDVEYGFIRQYIITDASVHDSQALTRLLDDLNTGKGVWADSAYRSAGIEWLLSLLNWISHIHERPYRNRPLSEEQQEKNTERSKTRSHVEHVFGAWVMRLGGKALRSIGLGRAEVNLGLKNLTYNFMRFIFWETRKPVLN
ncbi:MAG: IS5 family transposase [Leptolyngbya sp.]|nr:IS5 family transposase [Leptolyngbya sp.]